MSQYQDEPQFLPRDEISLNKFIESLSDQYELPLDNECVHESICTALMHMPQPAFKDVRSFCARYALDGMAKRAAYERLKQFDDKRKAKAQEAGNTEPVSN